MGDTKKETVQSFCMSSATKKSLLFVNGHLNTGGIEKTLVDLLAVIDYDRYDVDLLLLQGLGDYADRVHSRVKILSFDVRDTYGPLFQSLKRSIISRHYALVVFRLVILISKFVGSGALCLLRPILPVRKKYDCAIAYRTGFCAEVVAYSVKADKKLCWWHNGEFNYDVRGKAVVGRLLSSFTGIVAVSEGWKNRLSKEFPTLSSRINVMYNILDSRQLELSSSEFPLEFKGVDYPIVSVGNLTFRKHFDNIVYVVKKLLEDGINNFRWFIIGDGEEFTHISKLISLSAVGDHILMLGKRTNPYPYVRNAKLYVHPSYGEAHCTAILEAMALRTPCVVTETFVPQDFTHSGINCIEVSRDPQALYAGVLEMMKNPLKAEKMTDYAYMQVISDYSPEVISGSFYTIIEK